MFFRDVRAVIVAPAFGDAISGEMLDASHHSARRAQLLALKSANLGPSHGGAEKRIFSRALHDAPPAGVAGDINHRGKRPVDADGGGFPTTEIENRRKL